MTEITPSDRRVMRDILLALNPAHLDIKHPHQVIADYRGEIEAKEERLIAAIIPSAETKAAYIGEVIDPWIRVDDDGNEWTEGHEVSWTAIKEIMALIRKQAGIE